MSFMCCIPRLVRVSRLLLLPTLALACSDDVDPLTTPVELPRAVSIMVFPATFSLDSIGASLQVMARVMDDTGFAIPQARVSWESSDRSTASVTSEGVVTALAAGRCTITATHEKLVASAEVTIQ